MVVPCFFRNPKNLSPRKKELKERKTNMALEGEEKKRRVVEFYSGIGGMRCGLLLSGPNLFFLFLVL